VPQNREKPWVIREVPERTRRDVKSFAAEEGVPIAQAIEFLVDTALVDPDNVRARLHQAFRYFKATQASPGSATKSNQMRLLARVTEINQLRKEGKEWDDIDTSGLDIQALMFLNLVESEEPAAPEERAKKPESE